MHFDFTKIALSILVMAGALTMLSSRCNPQEGCTNPQALNYNPDADEDDGSCILTQPTSYEESVVGGQTTVRVTDYGLGTGDMTWTADKIWILENRVFVNNGQALTIEPGTIVKGSFGQGEDASALIVARGAQIYACGTAQEPIIFTAEGDDLSGNIPTMTRGLWGGVIVLGRASLNSVPEESAIEGIPSAEPRGIYGGSDDNDNSGSLCYISIRHGGTNIGASNEINGLTFGGVGAGTTVHHIEVISNEDDGFEFFGGTVNTHHLLAAFCGDDGFDYDEGFRGKGQFWAVVADPGAGNTGGEHDGGTSPETAQPYATPVIYNATYLGRGIGAGKNVLTFLDNAGGEYHNSIFANWGAPVVCEKLASGEDSYNRYVAGDLQLTHNIFWNVVVAGNGATAADIFDVSFGSQTSDATIEANWEGAFASGSNVINDPGILTDITTGGLNLTPTGNVNNSTVPTDAWFQNVPYQGAFDPNGASWITGWTLISDAGFLQ